MKVIPPSVAKNPVVFNEAPPGASSTAPAMLMTVYQRGNALQAAQAVRTRTPAANQRERAVRKPSTW